METGVNALMKATGLTELEMRAIELAFFEAESTSNIWSEAIQKTIKKLSPLSPKGHLYLGWVWANCYFLKHPNYILEAMSAARDKVLKTDIN